MTSREVATGFVDPAGGLRETKAGAFDLPIWIQEIPVEFTFKDRFEKVRHSGERSSALQEKFCIFPDFSGTFGFKWALDGFVRRD